MSDREQRIEELEERSKMLDLSNSEIDSGIESIHHYLKEFVARTEDGQTYIETEHKGRGIRESTVSEFGNRDFKDLFTQYIAEVDLTGLNPASGGHLGYIPGGGVLPSAFGDFVADFTNRYAGVFFANPGAVHMENMLIEWMAEVLGYPKTAYGNLASGGSISNLIAIVCARDGKEVKSADVPKSVIYLSSQAHHSVDKAIRIAGLQECIIRFVPVDNNFRLDAEKLEQTILEDRAHELNPFLVISSLGTTDTGSVDPIDAVGEVASKNDLWHHIDAAYGGFFLLTAEFKHLKGAVAKSDSITIDPHKGLFLPYGSGAVLVKDAELLGKSHSYMASYMQDTVNSKEERSPAEFSPELTKHFRGLRMWLPLMYCGLDPFRACLEEKIALTRYFYEKVQEIGFEVGPYPDLSVCIYRFVPEGLDVNDFNLELTNEIRKDGRVFLSSTKLDGHVWLRLAVLSFRSHKKQIDLTLEILQEYSAKLGIRK